MHGRAHVFILDFQPVALYLDEYSAEYFDKRRYDNLFADKAPELFGRSTADFFALSERDVFAAGLQKAQKEQRRQKDGFAYQNLRRAARFGLPEDSEKIGKQRQKKQYAA